MKKKEERKKEKERENGKFKICFSTFFQKYSDFKRKKGDEEEEEEEKKVSFPVLLCLEL